MRLSSRFLGLFVAAALFVACGDETSLAPLGSVSATGITFSPDVVTLTATVKVVTWGFLANGPHSVTFQDGVTSNGRVTGAWSRDFTTDTAGTYSYRCDYHFAQGMVGTVIVPAP